MNELIEAAKAVIDDWDSDGCTSPVYPRFDDTINALRAAVERAERHEAATEFREWWHSNGYGAYGIHHAQLAWIAAQQAERERIKEIVKLVGVQGEHDQWFECADTIMEMIDERTD